MCVFVSPFFHLFGCIYIQCLRMAVYVSLCNFLHLTFCVFVFRFAFHLLVFVISFGDAFDFIFFVLFCSVFLSLSISSLNLLPHICFCLLKHKYEIMKIKHCECVFHSIFIRALSLSLCHSLVFFFVQQKKVVELFRWFIHLFFVAFKFNLSLKTFAFESVCLIECAWIWIVFTWFHF